jgi:hypothetical protein
MQFLYSYIYNKFLDSAGYSLRRSETKLGEKSGGGIALGMLILRMSECKLWSKFQLGFRIRKMGA